MKQILIIAAVLCSLSATAQKPKNGVYASGPYASMFANRLNDTLKVPTRHGKQSTVIVVDSDSLVVYSDSLAVVFLASQGVKYQPRFYNGYIIHGDWYIERYYGFFGRKKRIERMPDCWAVATWQQR